MKRLAPILAWFLTIALLAQPLYPQNGGVTIRATVNVVILNVTVTGPDGKVPQNLTKDDFEVFEDGKLQRLQSADLEKLDSAALPPAEPSAAPIPAPASPASPAPAPASPARAPVTPATSTFKDRRMIVLLFDFSSMQPPDQTRAVDAAQKFIQTQLTSADMVSVMVFSSELRVLQDFTDDRQALLSTIAKFHIGESSELADMADTGADAEDQSGMYVADETEFNIFNTDRKLEALQEAARKLAQYPEKKALVYFSGGVEKTGVENQSQLRATVNSAVRSNVAFYPIDARGLQAAAPGGDATKAAAVGSSLYSGRGQQALRDSFQNQQETLDTLASETGGKALLDSNDLTLGIRQVQRDMNDYYVLVYESTNPAEDGKYRRVQIKLKGDATNLKAKLDYRPGYYAPVTFARMNSGDKESQLQQALGTENPLTDLPLAVETDYFRLAKNKYFVPISVRTPGSALSFQSKGSKAATELDFIAQVRDSGGRMAATVRDTIPLKLDQTTAGEVMRKQILYNTGVTLTPGDYKLRVVARENGEGKVGTFEDGFTVPNLDNANGLRVSSVILSNQRESASQQIAAAHNDKKVLAQDPLIDESGNRMLPNVTRVFRPGQTLYALVEVYDPVTREGTQPDANSARVSAMLSLYDATQKVSDSAPVRVTRLTGKSEGAMQVRLQMPLKDLPTGSYTCQVNLIDEMGKKFAFLRIPMMILPPDAPQTAALAQP